MSEVPYPPPHHILRDLAPVIERDAEGATLRLPVVPEMHDASGRVRAGVVATAVDILGGEAAMRAVAPGWIATSSLSLQVEALPAAGTLSMRSRVLRRGRSTVVIEITVDALPPEQASALATITFAALPSRTEFQRQQHQLAESDPGAAFGGGAGRLSGPLLDVLGARFDASNPGSARLEMRPYLVNSLGAMQGGVAALFAEAAAEHAAHARFGGLVRVRQIEIHYLKLAKVGPVRAEVRRIAELSGHTSLWRVELRDEGREDVLLTVANVMTDPVSEA
jgi:acyl-coenzyme A thioesterase PaaI-like protein